MFVHIVDAFLNLVQIYNTTTLPMTIPKQTKLNSIVEYNQERYYFADPNDAKLFSTGWKNKTVKVVKAAVITAAFWIFFHYFRRLQYHQFQWRLRFQIYWFPPQLILITSPRFRAEWPFTAAHQGATKHNEPFPTWWIFILTSSLIPKEWWKYQRTNGCSLAPKLEPERMQRKFTQ